MNPSEIQEKVQAIIVKQFSVAADRVTPDTKLEDDLGADSMALVELMVNLEEEFDMEMPALTGDEIQNVQKVSDVIEFIQTRCTSANG